MNRSGNTGFNGLVFFGNRGDGLFLLEGGEGIIGAFSRARTLCAVAARKEKVGQECWCGDGLV